MGEMWRRLGDYLIWRGEERRCESTCMYIRSREERLEERVTTLYTRMEVHANESVFMPHGTRVSVSVWKSIYTCKKMRGIEGREEV